MSGVIGHDLVHSMVEEHELWFPISLSHMNVTCVRVSVSEAMLKYHRVESSCHHLSHHSSVETLGSESFRIAH